jgi:hypothetical protein
MRYVHGARHREELVMTTAGDGLTLPSNADHPQHRGRRVLQVSGWAVVVLLALIGFLAALNRLVLLLLAASSHVTPATGSVDATYARHAPTMLLHVTFGLLFMLLGPLQFVRRLRAAHPQVHRWCGRVYIVAGLVLGVSALSIVFRFPVGGLNESTAVVFAAAIFLFSLVRAYLYIRQRDVVHHREWMIRAFSLGLAISTDRIVLVLLLIFTMRPFGEVFGIATWISFSLTLLAGEVWVNLTRPATSVARPRATPTSTRR